MKEFFVTLGAAVIVLSVGGALFLLFVEAIHWASTTGGGCIR